jgi:serine/threonine protein phosphatase PrpC
MPLWIAHESTDISIACCTSRDLVLCPLFQLLANLQADPAQLDTRPAAALASALVTANAQLRNASIDDTLSGTTACCTLVSGRSLHVANVGDSRAVLAERVPGGGTATAFAARELSQDQTPFR